MKSKIEEAYDLLKDADISSVKQYALLYLIIKRADELMERVKEKFIDENVNEVIPSYGVKVFVKDGKVKWKVDINELCKLLGKKKVLEIASVSLGDLKKVDCKGMTPEQVIAMVQKKVGDGSPYVSVSNLSKEDLANIAKTNRRVET